MPILAPTVIDQIAAAMSVRTLQHEVIASNIANRDAQGYQRMQLRFDAAMDRTSTASVGVDPSAAPVSLEQDMVALSANAAHYQALARTLSRYFSIASAITGSGRG